MLSQTFACQWTGVTTHSDPDRREVINRAVRVVEVRGPMDRGSGRNA